jgi:hypothetical protein
MMHVFRGEVHIAYRWGSEPWHGGEGRVLGRPPCIFEWLSKFFVTVTDGDRDRDRDRYFGKGKYSANNFKPRSYRTSDEHY